MKRTVPRKIAAKYKLPLKLSDFQLSFYIHLIEWKWKNITKKPGIHAGREYDALLPKQYSEKLFPVFAPVLDNLKNHSFKKHPYFSHMASSQAACINLFLPILIKPEIANEVLSRINPYFSHIATQYLENGFQFEYWDKSNPLNDHTKAAGTDSDIAIAYYNKKNQLCLWLIEHKLTEDEFTTCGGYHSKGNKAKGKCRNCELIMNDSSQCYYSYHCHYNYWQITHESRLFNINRLKEGTHCPFIGGENQLWRNQIMGYAIQNKSAFHNSHVSAIHHAENHDLKETMDSYKALLNDPSVFSIFTSKEIIEAAMRNCATELQNWIEWYSELYRV